MSKAKPKKKVVVTTRTEEKAAPAKSTSAVKNKKAKTKAAKPRTKSGQSASKEERRALTFGRDFYIWAGAGFGLVVIGLALMGGGQMPSPDVWDPDIIYSTRITVIAPFTMLIGLGLIGYAIFKK